MEEGFREFAHMRDGFVISRIFYSNHSEDSIF